MLTNEKLNLTSRFLLTIEDSQETRCGDPTEFCINSSEEQIIAMAAFNMKLTEHEAGRLMRSNKFVESLQVWQYKKAMGLIDSAMLDNPKVLDIAITNIDLLNRLLKPNTVMEDLGCLFNCDARNFKTMFKFYLAFEALGLETHIFKYWDFNLGIMGNLGRLGHNDRTIAKAALRSHLKANPARGFQIELLNNQYLMNNCDYKNVIGDICTKDKVTGSYLIMRLMLTPQSRIDDTTNKNLLRVYCSKWEKWFDGEETLIMDDGNAFYFHRHNLLRETQKAYQLGLFPDSMKTHPRNVYRDLMKSLAEKEYRKFCESLEGIPFPEIPEPFKRLDRKTWRLLDSPYALAIEGKRMNHCVGGSTFVSRARHGDVYYHYDDGVNAPATIELSLYHLGDLGEEHLLFAPHLKEGKLAYYTVKQIKHRYNENPSDDLKRKILIDLLNCGVGNGVADNPHTRLLAGAGKYSALRGLNTYQWYVRKPVKFIQLTQVKKPSEAFYHFGDRLRHLHPDLDIRELYPHQQGLIVQPRSRHIDVNPTLDRRQYGHLVADFDGDMFNEYNRHDAQWFGRAIREQNTTGDLIVHAPCPLSTGQINELFNEYDQARIRLGDCIHRTFPLKTDDNLITRLGFRLLSRRVRYGLISHEEMLEMYLRLRVRGKKAFCLELSQRSNQARNYLLDPFVGYNVKLDGKVEKTCWDIMNDLTPYQISFIDSFSPAFHVEPAKPSITPLFVTSLLGGYNLNLNIIAR